MANKPESFRSLELDKIIRDPALQMRVTISVPHVEEMAQVLRDGFELPPPIVFSDGQSLWLVDGNHTYEAHIAAGVRKMRCHIKPGEYRDAWLFSLSVNATHGLKRSQADKRKSVLAALRDPEIAAKMLAYDDAHPDGRAAPGDGELTCRCISKMCGLQWSTLVDDIKKELAAGLDKAEFVRGEGWRDSQGGAFAAEPENEQVEEEPDYPPEFGGESSGVDVIIEEALAASREGTTGVFDAKGRPVPETLIGVFKDGRLNEIRRDLRRVCVIVASMKLCDKPEPAARWIDVNAFTKLVGDAERGLRMGAPYIICPSCGGNKKLTGKPCDVCKAVGFLPESSWSRMDQDMRILAEQWTPRGEAWEGDDQPKILEATS